MKSFRFLALTIACCSTATALAQAPRAHFLHHEFLPPGVIGQEQLRKHAGMSGYFQAVELMAPEGTRIALLENGQYQAATPGPVLVGMQIGYVYSLQLTRIPNQDGAELFPSVELINRLYPLEATNTRFPVPIEITAEDIAQALSGLFVTRIVYLEDPDQALPRADLPRHQRSFDVAANEDPLHVADRLGRPMAIVRIGSRVPDEAEVADAGRDSAPLQFYSAPAAVAKPRKNPHTIERHVEDVPRQQTGSGARSARIVPGRRTQR